VENEVSEEELKRRILTTPATTRSVLSLDGIDASPAPRPSGPIQVIDLYVTSELASVSGE
jgi:hypothetical protein